MLNNGKMDSGITKAIKAKGTMAALARAIGITRAAICQWDRIPADRLVEIERATGVPRQELRPDLYANQPPAPDDAPSQPERAAS